MLEIKFKQLLIYVLLHFSYRNYLFLLSVMSPCLQTYPLFLGINLEQFLKVSKKCTKLQKKNGKYEF